MCPGLLRRPRKSVHGTFRSNQPDPHEKAENITRSSRGFSERFDSQGHFKSICHARVEDDALLLEPKATRSESTNLGRGKVEVEVLGPHGSESTRVRKLEPEFGKKPPQIR